MQKPVLSAWNEAWLRAGRGGTGSEWGPSLPKYFFTKTQSLHSPPTSLDLAVAGDRVPCPFRGSPPYPLHKNVTHKCDLQPGDATTGSLSITRPSNLCHQMFIPPARRHCPFAPLFQAAPKEKVILFTSIHVNPSMKYQLPFSLKSLSLMDKN